MPKFYLSLLYVFENLDPGQIVCIYWRILLPTHVCPLYTIPDRYSFDLYVRCISTANVDGIFHALVLNCTY